MVKLLFVCTGNICRSPTVEGVFRQELLLSGIEEIDIDSAGTQSYHVGDAPDPRSQAAASHRGVDLSDLRARKVMAQDYKEFDYLLAMDRSHLQWLRDNRPGGATARVEMFMNQDMPDPYYGGGEGFELVLDMAEEGSKRWIERLGF
jgi:protein-tyrosine phosphatase